MDSHMALLARIRPRFNACGTVLALIMALALWSPGKSALAQQQAAAWLSAEFRSALDRHGRWHPHTRWGEVWIPANRSRNWRPYTVGRWVHTEDWGWYWVEDSEEVDWGWITFHYGRWLLDRELGWAWLPGNQWGPGFVLWRHGRDMIAWGPLPPDEVIHEQRELPPAWNFVRGRDFAGAKQLFKVLLPPGEYPQYLRETTLVNRTVVLEDRRIAVNPGIPADLVAAMAGRPVQAYEVRPRIVEGTVQIPGALVVTSEHLRNVDLRAKGAIRETDQVVRPAARMQALQPLAADEPGRLGDNPPRAARSDAPITAEGSQPPTSQGQQPNRADQVQPRQPATEGRVSTEPGRPEAQGQVGPQPAREGRQPQKQPQPSEVRGQPGETRGGVVPGRPGQ